MNGKGSDRRPAAVSQDEIRRRWEKTFGPSSRDLPPIFREIEKAAPTEIVIQEPYGIHG